MCVYTGIYYAEDGLFVCRDACAYCNEELNGVNAHKTDKKKSSLKYREKENGKEKIAHEVTQQAKEKEEFLPRRFHIR